MFDTSRWGPTFARTGVSAGCAESASPSIYTDAMRRSVSRDDRAALIALMRDRPDGVSIPQVASMLLDRQDVGAALEQLLPRELALFDEDDFLSRVQAAATDLQSWEAAGMQVLTILDDDYPGSLRDIHESPPILFALGTLRDGDVGVSVVGSRQASPRGLSIASNVATALAQSGITVISGLAAGIDTAAHTAALAAGGRTVAVIGTGLQRYFPAENRNLQDEIARHGLVLSQFWPDAPPHRASFPIRNATMSGLGIATFVAEAGEKSGARIQARKAVEHGRPVILSDGVVQSNDWAQKLIGGPNVWQAGGVEEVMTIVRKLAAAQAEIADVVSTLAETLSRSA